MIKKVELKNFKCFERLEMPLSNLNLLSGINSMGKSTVIQALLLLRQAYEKGSLEKGIYLNGEYTQIGTGNDLLYFNADGDIEIILTDEADHEYKWILDYASDSDYLGLKKEVSEIDGDFQENLNLLNQDFEYIMAERFGPRKSYEKSFYDIQVKNHVGRYGEHAVYYLERHANDSVGTNTVVLDGRNTLKQQTERWMNTISPGIQFDFTDIQTADIISLKIRQPEGAAQMMGTIMDYKPVNVGFGISYSLPVIIALLKAKPDDLVILENPEAHLHPQGQRKVGELIARAAEGGVQVIVETHSDHILNGIRLAVKQKLLNKENVKLYYFCIKAKDGTTMHTFEEPKLDDNGRLNFWPEGFFDEWDNTLLELL